MSGQDGQSSQPEPQVTATATTKETIQEAVVPVSSIPESPLEPSSKSGCRRWQVEIEECAGSNEPIELTGTVVVTDDGWGIAEDMFDS